MPRRSKKRPRRTVKLKTGHGDVLLEFTASGAFVYSNCCGAPLTRRKAERLHAALTEWLSD